MKLCGSLMFLAISYSLYQFVSSTKAKEWMLTRMTCSTHCGTLCFAFESLGREFFLALWPLWNRWVARFTVRAEALARRTETFETIFADFGWDRQFSWRQSKRGWSNELESLVKSKSKLFRPSFAVFCSSFRPGLQFERVFASSRRPKNHWTQCTG